MLPAGTYWFTLADSDRNIVQVWNADRAHLVTTILAIPDYRQNTPQKTIINFEESPSGQPEAIQSWFYPGNNSGEEFVYPRTRAKQLAKQAGRPVLSMPDEQASTAEHIKQASGKAVNPSGEEIALQKSPTASKQFDTTLEAAFTTVIWYQLWLFEGVRTLNSSFVSLLLAPASRCQFFCAAI